MSVSISNLEDFSENSSTDSDLVSGNQDSGIGSKTEEPTRGSFNQVNNRHLQDDNESDEEDENEKESSKQPPTHIPQIGSVDDVQNVENQISHDPFGGASNTDEDET